MSIESFNRLLASAKTNPIRTIGFLIVTTFLFVAATYFGAYFQEKGKLAGNQNERSISSTTLDGFWKDKSPFGDFSSKQTGEDKVWVKSTDVGLEGTFRKNRNGMFKCTFDENKVCVGEWSELNGAGTIRLHVSENKNELSGNYTYEGGKLATFRLLRECNVMRKKK